MRYLEVLIVSLRLGLTSFGGPVAHLAYFHEAYVKKKKWISDTEYADLVALCQFLPGPASSQVGMAIGYFRAGVTGALLAWLGFTLPSALILIFFGMRINEIDLSVNQNWIHGLKVVAVAVVAQAVLAMARKLCPDRKRAAVAILSAIIILIHNSPDVQILVLILGSIYGIFLLKNTFAFGEIPFRRGSTKLAIAFLLVFAALLVTLPIVATIYPFPAIRMFDVFYQSGALVFGGGHVVLPLLQAKVVPAGLITNDLFMAGYGIANAIPGPLFAFSAYLGFVFTSYPNSWTGALICLIASFLPSFLIVIGVLPFWGKIKNLYIIRRAMLGINAAVVGILLAALYNPVWKSAIFSPIDFLIALIAFLMLERFKINSLIVLLITVIISLILY